jgi:hypothetical protein
LGKYGKNDDHPSENMGKLMIIPFLLGTYGKIDDHRNMRYSV